MSQMFIGIIGIVVVIGLAIAGAVYFGDQFQQSRSKSRAAAAIAATSQVANATSILLAQEGGSVAATADVTAQLVMRAARLDAFRRRRECLVEDIQVPALCGKPSVQVGEPVSMQLQKIRAFVQAEAVKHLR